MKRKFISTLFALVLVLTLGLVTAVPAAAASTLEVSKWTEYTENPVFDPGAKAYYPTVVYDANQFSGRGDTAYYKMWFGSNSGVGYAYSDDGIAWVEGSNPVSGLVNANHPLVEYYADGFTGANSGDNPSSGTMYYRIWYWDQGQLYSVAAIRYAESADGTAWYNDQAITGNIIGTAEWNRGSYGPIDVLYNSTATNTGGNPFDYSFAMYFDGTTGAFEEIGLGYSPDGIDWVLHGKVLSRGNDGPHSNTDDWDSSYTTFGTIIKEADGKWHMWYSGGQVDSNDGIGYAHSSDGLNWVRGPNNPIMHQDDGVAWRAERTYTPVVIEDGGIYKMWFSGKETATGNYAIGYATNTNPDAEYLTIQAAIDAANPAGGDTINVAAGTYTEYILIDRPLTVRSTDGVEETIIDGIGFRYMVRIYSADVTFEGFTVTNPTYEGGADATGILIGAYLGDPVSNVRILNNIVTQVRSETGTPSMFGATGINIGKGPLSDIVISGNTIMDIKNPGEKTESSPSDHTCGINIWDGAEGVLISNNTISDIKYNGIILEGASDVQIESNTMITECESGIRLEPRGGAISNIQIENNPITKCERGITVVPEVFTLSGLTINLNNFADNSIQVLDAAKALDIEQVLLNNTFDRAVTVDRLGTSLLHTIWSSIQDAVNEAVSGDTINVAAGAGTYDESVTIGTNNLTISGDLSRPAIAGGLKFDTDLAGLTLENFYVTGTVDPAKNSIVRMYGAITDLAIDNCVFDGENVTDRDGFTGGQLEGDVSITASEFKNILGWALLDSRSGSGGDGSAMGTVTFANNDVHDSNGTVVFRGLSTDWTDNVYIYENTFENIGQTGTSDHWAAFEVNRANNVEIHDNQIRNVVVNSWDEGQAVQLWQVGTVNIHDNTIENNYQGIAFLKWPAAETYDISNISIYNNSFCGNNQYALSVEDGLTGGSLNAENNYWGHATGVDHADNPHDTGQGGDVVTDNIDFIPWYATKTTTPTTEYVSVDHTFSSIIAYSDTIQGGIDAALSGDTVNVATGTYSEHITIDKSNLKLIGEDKETTIIDATQDSSWPVAKPGILIGEYPLEDGVHRVTVSGFTIQDAAMQEGDMPYEGDKYGVGPGGLAGIQIYNSSSNIIEDNILINNYWQIWLVAEWPAAGYTECKNNRIANNIIQNSENDGVYLYSDGGVYVENTEIVNNEISNAFGELASGVEFWGWAEGDDTPTISGTVVEGNLVTGCTYGVRIRDDVSDITGTSVKYNDFVDNTNYGIYNGVASTINATRNWWGHASGPGCELSNGKWVGKGDKVSDNVNYKPWLHKSKEKIVPTKEPAYAQSVVLDNTGDYGWNTFSAPIFLDDEADTWEDLYDPAELDYSVAYRFDSDIQEFVPLTTADDYAISPGEGFFIKMNNVGCLTILYSTEENLTPPSRPLTAGWNLIGLASLEDMNVDDAFASIATAPGLAGYSQVVSPIGNVSPGAVLADGTIYVGESYWVYMLGARTLAGFTMTPVEWVP